MKIAFKKKIQIIAKVYNQEYFYFFGRKFFYKNFAEEKSFFSFFKEFLGFNFSKFCFILKRVGLSFRVRLKNLSPKKLLNISQYLEKYYLSELHHKLKKERVLKNYIKYGFYKGLRMKQGMPLRGQRSRTNAQTTRRKVY